MDGPHSVAVYESTRNEHLSRFTSGSAPNG
jgi:hypothetical protein